MQTILNQILDNNFNYDNRYLDFSCTKIDISLTKSRIYEGSFHIYGPEGSYTHGNVFSSDRRLEILTKKFAGSSEEIYYRFRGEEMEEGDVVRGTIFIVSNQGEYSIPFSVSRECAVMETSIGPVKNLSHFAALAKENWQEAVKLFYSSDFKRVFAESEQQYAESYRALSEYKGSEQNVEEFLIHINKKQRCEFLVQENQISIGESKDGFPVSEHELTIIKNGWGYTSLNIECVGDFLFTEKEELNDDDFLGNTCKLSVFADRNQCHQGENFGKIILFNSFLQLEIPVHLHVGEGRPSGKVIVSEKTSTLRLMKLYQDFRAKRIDVNEWLKESGKIADRMAAQDETNIGVKLFQAQLLITEERFEEAGWTLDTCAGLLDRQDADETLLAYYYYLTSLIHRESEYVNRVTAEVEHIYRKDNTNWRVAWLLLFLSDEYHKSPTGRWVFLEKQFNIGCMSPLLYIEAVILLNNNPALLRRPGEFEQNVLWYGVKQEMLTDDVIEQMLYLCEKIKEYSYPMFRALNRLYETRKDARLLQQICSLLIKGGKVGEEYFRYYRDGVDLNLHITNLYEFYMMSLDLNKKREIPKRVLMYFSYQNNLDFEHTAYMYGYILDNEITLRDIYATYKTRIEHFCIEQIQRQHLNRSLADIYNKFLQPGMLTEETCDSLSRILFGHLIQVKDDRIRKVYVYQPDRLVPDDYNLLDGKTWVALYGGDYTLCFEDAYGNRFTKSVEYTCDKVMYPGKFLQQLDHCRPDNLGLDLYYVNTKKEESLVSPVDVERALRVAESPLIEKTCRHRMMMKVLLYYYEKDAFPSLDAYLSSIPMEELSPRERGEVIQYLILRDRTEEAGQMLAAYGPYFIDTKLLVRLLDELLDKNGMTENSTLTAAALYAFRKGRYDSTVLYYLSLYYKGTTREARDIWKTAKVYQLDCFRICEQMLIQMLYTGAFIHEQTEVFRYYVQNNADPQVEGVYLAHCATEFYLKDKPMEHIVFDEIRHMHVAGQPLLRIAKLAFLKYYAVNSAELTAEAAKTADDFLEELMNQGIHMEFFRNYKNNPQVEQEMSDKVIFEYRGNSETKAYIHYCLTEEGQEPGPTQCELLREVASGIFCKEFILFFGETIEYYITEEGVLNEEDGTEQILESGTLTKEDPASGAGRYRLINDVVASRCMGEYEKMDALLEKYYKREYLNAKLFALK